MDAKKLWLSFTMLAGLLAFGTCAYYFIEGMPFFDAFYMTIITVSTVGFSEIKPLSPWGRLVTVLIIVWGVSVGTYTIGTLARFLIEGELRKVFGRRKLGKQISELKHHFIICGFGRIGRVICDELYADRIDFVVIEQDPVAIEQIQENNYLFVEADATSEEALLKAGILKARGLVTAVQSDANNLFITLTAKSLRPDIFVLSRSSEEKNESKLLKAGATRVVSPYLIGARRMAHIMKRPTVVDFIDIATMGSKLGLIMEEARVGPNSSLVNKNLIDSHLRQDFGVIIVAIKKSSGEMIFNPQPSERLDSEDVIVVLGKREDLKRMNAVL